MPKEKQLPDLALGRRMPHRLLHVMPAQWKRNYLLRQSGGEENCESFNLVQPFQNAERFLITWPERREEALIAFPALRVLREAIGKEVTWLHLVAKNLMSMIEEFFPGDQVLSWTRDDLAWHEASVQILSGRLRIFSPQLSINLMQPCPTVLQALVKASRAGLRIALDDKTLWPYANMRLMAESGSPLAAHYFQILSPWRYAEFVTQEKWAGLSFDEGRSQDALSIWTHAGADPSQNWIYLHDATNPARPLDDDLYSWLWERVHTRDSEEAGIVLVVMNPTSKIVVQEGMWRNIPVIKSSEFSELFGIVSLSRGVIGFQGWGIHCASLAGVPCVALLQPEESAYDVSRWNKLFEVETPPA